MQKVKNTFTWASGETDAIVKTIHERGVVKVYYGVFTNATNPITFTVTVKDEDGVQLYTKADFAENATELVASLNIPVDKGFTITVTPSGDPGASGVIGTVVLFVQQDEL
jgi:hypothetical protein